MLLLILKKIQQPSPALIHAYLYICKVRNETVDAEIQKAAGTDMSLSNQYDEMVSKRNLLADLDAIIAEKKEIIAKAGEQILSLKEQTVELEEIALLQDFGLYQPMYNFATSSQCKEKLNEVRAKQKQMIKDKTAATCQTQWTVNGSRREGKKAGRKGIRKRAKSDSTGKCKGSEGDDEERRRIEKEQTHYKNQMQSLIEQMNDEKDISRQALIDDKITAIKNELADLDRALADVDYRQANERAGYVYVISNISAFGEGIYKIGMTRRLEPMDRIDELGGASIPFRFDVHALIFSTDALKLETALHNAFADRKVRAYP